MRDQMRLDTKTCIARQPDYFKAIPEGDIGEN